MSFENAIKSVLKTVNKVFGVSCVYKYSTGGTKEIKGVFDNEYIEILNVNTLNPVLKIRLGDLDEEPNESDSVLINSITYNVIGSRPDNFGSTTLILEKA